MPAPIISVVLPTFNRGATLKRAIDSVLKQTYTDFELIVIDDCSTDETASVLAQYCGLDNVCIVTQLRRGCAAARNLGVHIARGRYIAFQDSDDEWQSHKLEIAVRVLNNANAETGVFYSDMTRVHADGSHTSFGAPDVLPGVLISEDRLDYQVFGIGIQSAVIKRECFESAGLFDESLSRYIDLELFIRLSDHFDFVHCQEPLVRYYAGEGISTNSEALVEARRYLLTKYQSRLRQKSYHLAMQHVKLASALWRHGRVYESLLSILRALFISPKVLRHGLRFGKGRLGNIVRRWKTTSRLKPMPS